jgi:hypothetical protein
LNLGIAMKLPEKQQVDEALLNPSRKPYEPPTLKRIGTIQELTRTLPGTSPTDNDPFAPGSTF